MNIPFDHELMINNKVRGLKLVRDGSDQSVYYTVSDFASSGLQEYQEELRYTQNDWKGGHGFYNYSQYDPDKYFEGSGIDTTVTGELFLGPKVNEVKEDDGTYLDSPVVKFIWFNKAGKLACFSYAYVYRYGVGPMYEYQDEYGSSSFWLGLEGLMSVGQTFTPVDAHTITKVDLKIEEVYGTPGTLTVEIYAADGSHRPTGAALASGTYDTSTISSDEWITVSLGAGAALSASTEYVIVATCPDSDAGEYVAWKRTASSYYARGQAITKHDTDPWTTISVDMLFREYSDGATYAWTSSASIPYVVDVIEYNGVLYAAMGLEAKYQYSSDGVSWTSTDLDDGYANGFLVTRSADGTESLLWKFKTPNEVSSTSDGRTVADGGVEWTSPYYIGDTSYNITKLFAVGDELYAGKEDSLWKITASGRTDPKMQELSVARGANNFKHVANWRGKAYFSLVNGMGELDAGENYDKMGPLTEIDNISKEGTVCGITADTDFIYVAVNEGTETIIYKGRQITRYNGLRWEWCPFINLSTNVINDIYICQHSSTDKRLWFSYGSGGNYSTGYVSLFDNPLASSSAEYASSGWVRMPYIYGTDPYYDKLFQSVITETLDCGSGQTVTIKYRKDTDTSATTITSPIEDNGFIKTDFNEQIDCNKIQFEIHLATDDSTSTPRVRYFQARGMEVSEDLKVYNAFYSVKESQFESAKDLIDFLREGKSTTSLVKFTNLHDSPKGLKGDKGRDWIWVKMMGVKETTVFHGINREPEVAVNVMMREVSF